MRVKNKLYLAIAHILYVLGITPVTSLIWFWLTNVVMPNYKQEWFGDWLYFWAGVYWISFFAAFVFANLWFIAGYNKKTLREFFGGM